jgi:hypothetical protein
MLIRLLPSSNDQGLPVSGQFNNFIDKLTAKIHGAPGFLERGL